MDKFFLSQKNVFVKKNSNFRDRFGRTAKLAEGNVIASILFLIYIRFLPQRKAQISQFAEDFTKPNKSRYPKLIQKFRQSSLISLIV